MSELVGQRFRTVQDLMAYIDREAQRRAAERILRDLEQLSSESKTSVLVSKLPQDSGLAATAENGECA